MGFYVLTLDMDEDPPLLRPEARIKAGDAFVFFEAGCGWLGTIISLHSSSSRTRGGLSLSGQPFRNKGLLAGVHVAAKFWQGGPGGLLCATADSARQESCWWARNKGLWGGFWYALR